jgi:two-component system phosphate regulon sensor histidine kinase PhoR
VPIRGDNGGPRSVVISAHDITHLKELERFKEQFVANAVHDLSTPIAGLVTRIYLLKHAPEKTARHLQSLESQVEHLHYLLEDLRTLSRLDRGKIELTRGPADFNAIVRRVFDTYEPLAINRQQTIRLQLAAGLPRTALDERQIERVVANLVSNAIHYTPEGRGIQIFTRLQNDAIYCEVKDEGIGIPIADVPRVFERFYRSDEARLSRADGTGLGLAIVKEVVELHGGRVGVQSVEGEGSRFWLWLPVGE